MTYEDLEAKFNEWQLAGRDCEALVELMLFLLEQRKERLMSGPSLRDYAVMCHAANIKWWQDPHTGAAIKRNRGELLMLMVSELAECMEAERKNKADDHLPNRPGAEVELVDAMIRIFDYVGAYGGDISNAAPDNMTFNQMAAWAAQGVRPANKGQMLGDIVKWLFPLDGPPMLAMALHGIFRYAGVHHYDLDGAFAEKMAYNAQRQDHTHEARRAAGGKRW